MTFTFESTLPPTLTAPRPRRPPRLPALLAGALAISSGCSAVEPSGEPEAPAGSEHLAASASALSAPPFERVLTAWDQPEEGWAGYTLHTVDVDGE